MEFECPCGSVEASNQTPLLNRKSQDYSNQKLEIDTNMIAFRREPALKDDGQNFWQVLLKNFSNM
jgi:hypothetical protein